MAKIWDQIRIGLDDSLEEKLQLLAPGHSHFRVLRQSVDARGRSPKFVYSVEVFADGESIPTQELTLERLRTPQPTDSVVIVGAGPAGLFAALRLVERGIPCQILEQGSEAVRRMRAIAEYWRYGKLDERNNVCFGEGGAGLYSDGKLITRIRSEHIPYVLNRLVKFGAPAEIEYVSNPHVGSDRIRKVIPPLRNFLRANGCDVSFDTKVSAVRFSSGKVSGVEIEGGRVIPTSRVILATGHSAIDVLQHLHAEGVELEGKSFAMGLRIEHPQAEIDRMQYGEFSGHPKLGAANYRLTDHNHQTGIGVYSFCMCPGGYVIASSTHAGEMVSNGMSNFARNSPFANAAIVVSVDHQQWFGKDKFGGISLRAELERRAFAAVQAAGGTRQFPAQRLSDFMAGRTSALGRVSAPSGAVPIRLDELLPASIRDRLRESLCVFDHKMPGFAGEHAVLFGVESRTSCPVRVVRDENSLQSVSHPGLYPTGEGAGYAGGITSAAVDGIRVAEAIFSELS